MTKSNKTKETLIQHVQSIDKQYRSHDHIITLKTYHNMSKYDKPHSMLSKVIT